MEKTKKKPGRKRIIISGIVTIIIMLVYFFSFELKQYTDPKVLSRKITKIFSDDLRREFSYQKVYFEGKNLILTDVALKERQAFSKGDFLKIKKLVLALKWTDLFLNKTISGKIKVTEPTLIVKRNLTGTWNIWDLSLFFKQESKFKIEKLSYEIDGGLIITDDKKTDFYLHMSDFNLYLNAHESLKADGNGIVNATYKNQHLNLKSFFEAEAENSSKKVEFILSDIKLNNTLIGGTQISLNLENADAPLIDRKIKFNLATQNVSFKGEVLQNEADFFLFSPFMLYKKLYGGKLPSAESLGVKNLDIRLNYDEKSWNVKKFTFESPHTFLDLYGNIDVVSQNLDLKFNLKLGTENFKIEALGKLPNPKVKPEMSGTINKYLMTGFKGLQNLLDKYYVNQE